jgi:hypothetical protein
VTKAFRNTAISGISVEPKQPAGVPRGTYVRIAVTLPPTGPGSDVEAMWQADIAMGAVAELVNNGTPGILCNGLIGAIVSGRTARSGTVAPVSEPVMFTNAPANQYFAASADTSAQIATSVAHTASSFGLTPSSVRVLDADGPAIEVVLTTPDSVKLTEPLFLHLTSALLPHPSPYVGAYLEIRDQSGAPLIKIIRSARTSSGGQWIAPGTEVGYPHG